MTKTSLSIAVALVLLGCGGPAADQAARAGGNNTGSEQIDRGRFAGSGGEVAAGDCSAGPVYFAFDSSELDGQSRAALETSARCLAARNAGARVTGMTDPRGTEEYNLALGERRAQTTARFLSNLGVDDVSTHSMGEERARGEDERGWAQDRRADIQVQ